ncbi:MAG: hypothetical protein AAF939_22250, partial [Planctomycetota bacterium]
SAKKEVESLNQKAKESIAARTEEKQRTESEVNQLRNEVQQVNLELEQVKSEKASLKSESGVNLNPIADQPTDHASSSGDSQSAMAEQVQEQQKLIVEMEARQKELLNEVSRLKQQASQVSHVAGDGLTMLKGVGPKSRETLLANGVTSLNQIASWSQQEANQWQEKLGKRFRISKDAWVEQAKKLTGSDNDGGNAWESNPPTT